MSGSSSSSSSSSLRIAISYVLSNVTKLAGAPVRLVVYLNAPTLLRHPAYVRVDKLPFPVAAPHSDTEVHVVLPLVPGVDIATTPELRACVATYGTAFLGVAVYARTRKGEPLAVASGARLQTARTYFYVGTASFLLSDLELSVTQSGGAAAPVEAKIIDTSTRLREGGASNPVGNTVGVLQLRVLNDTLPAALARGGVAPRVTDAVARAVQLSTNITVSDFRTLMSTYRTLPAAAATSQSLYNTGGTWNLPAGTFALSDNGGGMRESGAGGRETAREVAFLRQSLLVAAAEHGLAETQLARAASGAEGTYALTLASQIVLRASTLYALSMPYVSEVSSYREEAPPPPRTDAASGRGGALGHSGSVPGSLPPPLSTSQLVASGALAWVSPSGITALRAAEDRRWELSEARDFFDTDLSASGAPDCEDGAADAYSKLMIMRSAGRVIVMGSGAGADASPLQRAIAAGEGGEALRAACRLLYSTAVPAIGFYAASSAAAGGPTAADRGGGGESYAAHQAVELYSLPSFAAMLPAGTAARYPGIEAALSRARAHPGFMVSGGGGAAGTSASTPPYSVLHGETTGSSKEQMLPTRLLPHTSASAAALHLSALVDEGRFVRELASSGARHLLDMGLYVPPNMPDAASKDAVWRADTAASPPLSGFKRINTSLMTSAVRELSGRADAAAKFNFVTVRSAGATDHTRERVTFSERTATLGASVASVTLSGLRGEALPFAVKLLAHDGLSLSGARAADGLGVLPAEVVALSFADVPVALPRLDPADVGMRSAPPPKASTLRPLYDALLPLTTPGATASVPVPDMVPYAPASGERLLVLWCSDRAVPRPDDVRTALSAARARVPALSGVHLQYAQLVAPDIAVGTSGGLARLYLMLTYTPARLGAAAAPLAAGGTRATRLA